MGSAIIVLLMLASAQIVFLKTVKSDPTRHTGPGDVGDLWITELDVSSDIMAFDYIGISHVNATDDWVNWPGDGAGYINASWSVGIEPRAHCEYYVIYTFEVIHVDDNNKELGNDSFQKTYEAYVPYDESGTLSVAIQFTQQQQQMMRQTLVCILSAYVRANDTLEAENFTCTAQDRCIVGVQFDGAEGPPGSFSTFKATANDLFPSMWSWIKGWDLSARYANEGDMLCNQTCFFVNSTKLYEGTCNEDWYIGNLSLDLMYFGRINRFTKNFTVGNTTANWSLDGDDIAVGDAYGKYYVNDAPARFVPPVRFRLLLWASEPAYKPPIGFGLERRNPWEPRGGSVWAKVLAPKSYDINQDDYIHVNGWYWAATFNIVGIKLSNYANYKIHLVSNASQNDSGNSDSFDWKYSCAYQNGVTTSVDFANQSGITTVKPDISNAITVANGCIYSFSGDRGKTRVEFVV